MAFEGPYPTVFSGHTSVLLISATTFSGGVTNTGTIGPAGIAIFSGNRIVASGGATQTAIAVENTRTFGGAINNSGLLSAAHVGIFASSISAFTGGIRNSGTIAAASYAIVVADADTFAGGITNSGQILGGGSLGADGHGGTLVSEASQTAQPLLTHPKT